MLLIFFIPLLLYSITLTFGFVYDDREVILGNPWIRDIKYIPDMFTSSVWAFQQEKASNYYRPVFLLALMVEHYIFGLKAWGFHLVSVLLHAVNSVLVFLGTSLFLSSGTGEARGAAGSAANHLPAFVAGLVFTLHTVNTEAVSWVSATSELLITLFLLISFYLYISAGGGRVRKSAFRYAVSVFCFILALLTKETAIVLVLLIPAYDFSKYGVAFIRRWRAYPPYLITAALYMAVRSSIVGGVVHHKAVDISAWETMVNVFPFLARYFAKLILPTGLSVAYPIQPVHSITEPAAIIGILTVFLFLCALLIFRRNKPVFFSLLWILIPLLPAMYVPAISISSMADRYLYLSTIGFAVIVAYFVRFVFERARPGGYWRPAVVVLTAAVLVLYSAGTVTRSLAWKDDRTLWTAAAEKYPASPLLRLKLAVTLHKLGETGEAIAQYKEVIRVNPGMEKAHYNLAVLYQEQGDHAGAITRFKEVVRINPRNFTAYYLLALSYQKMGDVRGAVGSYREAIRIKPDYEDAHYNLAWTYQSMGDSRNAIIHYKTVIRLSPWARDAHYNLGLIYAGKGRLDEAAHEFSETLRIDPSYSEGRAELERVLRLKSHQ